MTAALSVQAAHKRFKDAAVLRGLDCEVAVGEAFGLVGANGAGKTTLLKAVLDYLPLDGGAIEIFGRSWRRPAARRRLAFLPERFVPPYFLSGQDFIDYLTRLHGVTNSADEVRAIADVVQLDVAALRQSVREYSKGMAQKLGLAATFLCQRELLLMDEPLSGLDPAARASIKHHLLALRGAGRTLLFTTHMLNDVEELCGRIGILHGGVLRFSGSIAECKDRYQAGTLEAAYLRCVEV